MIALWVQSVLISVILNVCVQFHFLHSKQHAHTLYYISDKTVAHRQDLSQAGKLNGKMSEDPFHSTIVICKAAGEGISLFHTNCKEYLRFLCLVLLISFLNGGTWTRRESRLMGPSAYSLALRRLQRTGYHIKGSQLQITVSRLTFQHCVEFYCVKLP